MPEAKTVGLPRPDGVPEFSVGQVDEAIRLAYSQTLTSLAATGFTDVVKMDGTSQHVVSGKYSKVKCPPFTPWEAKLYSKPDPKTLPWPLSEPDAFIVLGSRDGIPELLFGWSQGDVVVELGIRPEGLLPKGTPEMSLIKRPKALYSDEYVDGLSYFRYRDGKVAKKTYKQRELKKGNTTQLKTSATTGLSGRNLIAAINKGTITDGGYPSAAVDTTSYEAVNKGIFAEEAWITMQRVVESFGDAAKVSKPPRTGIRRFFRH